MAIEHSTFWRQFCAETATEEGSKAKQAFLDSLRDRAHKDLGIEAN